MYLMQRRSALHITTTFPPKPTFTLVRTQDVDVNIPTITTLTTARRAPNIYLMLGLGCIPEPTASSRVPGVMRRLYSLSNTMDRVKQPRINRRGGGHLPEAPEFHFVAFDNFSIAFNEDIRHSDGVLDHYRWKNRLYTSQERHDQIQDSFIP